MARPEVGPATPDDPIRLLHADEEHLRLAAVTLRRGGRFVLVVADHRLWPAALRHLRELLPEHRFVEHAPTSSDEANQAISDPLRNDPGLTIVLRITGQDAGPLETLNLRRESLVGAPANFLVVLDGGEAHSRFLREAPDCYSYRDLLVTLEGKRAFEAPTSDEDWERYLESALVAAQQAPDPAERARLLLGRAIRAVESGQPRLARTLAEAGIAVLASREPEALQEDERMLLARLYFTSAEDSDRSEFRRCTHRALDVLAPVAERYPKDFITIEGAILDGIGIDLQAALDAVRRAREHGAALGWPLMSLAEAHQARGNIVRARGVIGEIPAAEAATLAHTLRWLTLHFDLLVDEGAWAGANQLVSPTGITELAEPMHRTWLARREAKLLRQQGEGDAAQQLYERLPADLDTDSAMIQLAADQGRLEEAGAQLDELLQRPWTANEWNVDGLLWTHELLVELVEQQIAAGGSLQARDVLDSRLAALQSHVEHQEAPGEPPWYRIQCLLIQSDAYLKRTGAEHLALARAEQASTLAEVGDPALAPRAIRRCVVAALRLGEIARAQTWLSRGLARARELEIGGDEAHLRSLALWHAALAGEDTAVAEAAMQAAFAASGSRLVEASALARVGAALGRRDLLRRAQQIYRSLPWPAREGACLEALGETQIAEARYRTYGLVTRSMILARRSGPPPITAVDDE